MATHWYLIAHRAGARIFEQQNVAPDLALIERIEHEEGRLRAQDLVSDRQGRADVDHHTFDSTSDPTKQVEEQFARSLVNKLQSYNQENRFDSLTLVAEDSLLGFLRKLLDSPLQDKVRLEVAKNLGAVSEHEIAARLGDVLLDREPVSD